MSGTLAQSAPAPFSGQRSGHDRAQRDSFVGFVQGVKAPQKDLSKFGRYSSISKGR